MVDWRRLCKRAEVKADAPLIADAGGTRVAVFDIGGTLYCIEDVCTHDDGPVAEGVVRGDEIECPRHGARFDIKSGAVRSMPAVVPIRTFPVKVQGEDVLVQLE